MPVTFRRLGKNGKLIVNTYSDEIDLNRNQLSRELGGLPTSRIITAFSHTELKRRTRPSPRGERYPDEVVMRMGKMDELIAGFSEVDYHDEAGRPIKAYPGAQVDTTSDTFTAEINGTKITYIRARGEKR
ncbi:MAG TPA: hypothetical protein VEW42_06640 [Candidatus Eisenbacteria bacterium]|nr:hypothetical protein [Candidatus Eisenbacteria bacterium]